MTQLKSGESYVQDTLTEAFVEYAEGPPPKMVVGPHGPEIIDKVLKPVSEALPAIHPDLQPDILAGERYQSPGTLILGRSLTSPQRGQVFKLSGQKRRGLADIGRRVAEHQPLSEPLQDVLNTPEHRTQRRMADCSLTTYSMILGDILDIPIDGELFREGAAKIGAIPENEEGALILDDEVLVGIIKTKAINRLHGNKIESLSFVGFDLSTIATIARRFRDRLNATKVFSVATVDSIVSIPEATITHKVILTRSDELNVYAHDSRKGESGGANIPQDIRSFYLDWAQGLLGGYIVAELPERPRC